MELKNSSYAYGAIAKFFHWLSALCIVCLFVLGLWMIDLDYDHQWYDLAFHYHESIGVLLAVFILLRWLWRQINVSPTFEPSLSTLEKRSAIIAHRLMYLLCFIIFMTGYLIPTADGRSLDVFMWFSVPAITELTHQHVDLAGDIHFWLACGLMALASIHAFASFKHHFIDKDRTLKKIY